MDGNLNELEALGLAWVVLFWTAVAGALVSSAWRWYRGY